MMCCVKTKYLYRDFPGFQSNLCSKLTCGMVAVKMIFEGSYPIIVAECKAHNDLM